MARVPTSINIDPDLWAEFKKYCIDKNPEVSARLARLIRADLAQQPQGETGDEKDWRIALAVAYDGLIEQYGPENVDRCHEFLQKILRR